MIPKPRLIVHFVPASKLFLSETWQLSKLLETPSIEDLADAIAVKLASEMETPDRYELAYRTLKELLVTNPVAVRTLRVLLED